MNIAIKILICILLIPAMTHASIPTSEGLFRNGNNADVSATLIMIKSVLSTKVSSMLMEKPAEEITAKEETEAMKDSETKYYAKFLLSVEPNDRVQLIQAIYTSGKMNDSDLADIRYFSNLEEKIKKSSHVQGLFYGLLTSLALNRSREINTFLKINSKNYKSNSDLIDPEKKALYEKYKRYLKLIKEDDSLKETMANPMKPEDAEVATVVEKIKNRSFMLRDQNVNLVKTTNGYKWVVDLDVLNAVFDNKSHQLEKLSFGKIDKNLMFNFDNYILFDGTHELPKKIKIVSPDEENELRISSLTHLNIGNKSMSTRYGEYRKILDESKMKEEEVKVFLTR